MEKTSRLGILGRHRFCDSERIDILSDSIERFHYPFQDSEPPDGLLRRQLGKQRARPQEHQWRSHHAWRAPQSCRIEDWRSLIRKSMNVTSTSTKDLTTSRMTRELGSKVVRQPEGEAVRQPEGEVVRQTKFSNQPNQLQIQFVIDQSDLMT